MGHRVVQDTLKGSFLRLKYFLKERKCNKRLNNGTHKHTHTYTYINKKLLRQLRDASLLDDTVMVIQ